VHQKTSFIKDLTENVSIEDVFALESMELIPFREKPGRYLRMRLADRTGEVSAFVWDNAEDVREQIAHSDFVKVSGITRIYRDKLSITVTMVSCMDGNMVDPNDFLPCTQKDRQFLLEELRSHVEKIKNHHLRSLLGVFLDDTGWVREFSNAPAAKRMHQAYLGGLLEHTVNMLHLVPAVCSNYPQVELSEDGCTNRVQKPRMMAAIRIWTDSGVMSRHFKHLLAPASGPPGVIMVFRNEAPWKWS